LSNPESRFAVSSSIAVSIERPSSFGAVANCSSRGSTGGSGGPAGRLSPLALLGLLAVLAAAACSLFAASASAQLAHPAISYEVGPDGTPATEFTYPTGGLAYQQANKRLYVESENKLYGFSNPSPGTFTPLGGNLPFAIGENSFFSGIAVDNTGGPTENNLYHAYSTSTTGYDEALTALSGWPVSDEFHEMCGVAVDNEGNVWVAEYGSNGGVAEWAAGGGSRIQKLETYPLVGNNTVCKIAIDQSNNDLYLWPSGPSDVYRLSAASGYTAITTFPVGESYGSPIAVDGQHHILFAGYGESVKAFDTQTGRVLETIRGVVGNIYGIAVEETTGTLFLNSTYNPTRVAVLKAIEVPQPTTEEPTDNHQISGFADPDGAGEITECFFQWGTSTSYGNTEECEESTPISSAGAVHATLAGLIGEQAYHYRLVLKNENGAAYGEDKTILPHNVIAMHTEPATEITRTTARLNGVFEGTGEETTYYFEYGTSTSYGSRWPEATDESAGVTTGSTPMSVVVSNLLPETTYHFRVVAENEKGKNIGEDQSFSTPKAVGDLATEDATAITKHSAVLNASFTGTGEPHTFYFEWGPTSAYGNSTPVKSAGSGTGTVSVATEIEGLEIYLPDSLPYHYRVVATNSTGTTVGPDHTFETLPPGLPQVALTGVLGTTPGSATVSASINPGGGETVFLVEYGLSGEYGSETEVSHSIGEDEAPHTVSAQLEGLSPGTTYHYTVVAFNFAGTVHSADATVTTSGSAASPTPIGGGAGVASPPAPIAKPMPRKCKSGYAKRHGRCVKQNKKKHHKHRKHNQERHGNG
jgi:hypothetical protein